MNDATRVGVKRGVLGWAPFVTVAVAALDAATAVVDVDTWGYALVVVALAAGRAAEGLYDAHRSGQG